MSIAIGTGVIARSVSRASMTNIATRNEQEKRTVSHVSMVNSRTPTPSTSTSPMMRANWSPIEVR